jgi:hypothetical protein
MRDEQNPIKRITIVSQDDDAVHEVGGDVEELADSLTESGTAFIVHESAGGAILCTTVYPMPGVGDVVAIEIERF